LGRKAVIGTRSGQRRGIAARSKSGPTKKFTEVHRGGFGDVGLDSEEVVVFTSGVMVGGWGWARLGMAGVKSGTGNGAAPAKPFRTPSRGVSGVARRIDVAVRGMQGLSPKVQRRVKASIAARSRGTLDRKVAGMAKIFSRSASSATVNLRLRNAIRSPILHERLAVFWA
jgi:hypothetical protein